MADPMASTVTAASPVATTNFDSTDDLLVHATTIRRTRFERTERSDV
jgi:hypothetical protein